MVGKNVEKIRGLLRGRQYEKPKWNPKREEGYLREVEEACVVGED